MPSKKTIPFEEKLNKLEGIVEQIESPEIELEKAIALYKDGIKLAKECGETLQKHEEEILVLQKTAEEFILEPFSLGAKG